MLTITYRLLCAAAAILVGIELFRQNEVKNKVNAAIVIVPLVLRALMII